MLATAITDINALKYPCWVSGKLDGIRCLKINGRAVTRNLKPVRNTYTREWLEALLPDGADGELVCGNFQETTSAVTSEAGKPHVRFFWFDWIMPGTFLERQAAILDYVTYPMRPMIVPWLSVRVSDPVGLLEKEAYALEHGMEGLMVRNDGPYKHGRSTLKEGYLLKLKRFQDSEARVVGFQQLVREDGTPIDMLGALLVEDAATGVAFGIGSGFTAAQRQHVWENRASWHGTIVKYKHQEVGTKTAPRFPVFLGRRDPADMG